MEFNRCFPYNSSVMSSGEKYKMVSSTNQLFIQLSNNLQQEHCEELKSNRIHNNKLYYTRQDYSKSEKKLKRSKQQLDSVKEDISLCKQEIIDTDNEKFRLYTERVMEQGGLVSDKIQHQRLSAQREMRTKLFTFGQQFAHYVQDGKDQGKSKVRILFERVFGLKKEKQQKKLNVDINSMLFGNVLESLEVVDVLKNIGKSSSSDKSSGIKAMSRDLLNKLGH